MAILYEGPSSRKCSPKFCYGKPKFCAWEYYIRMELESFKRRRDLKDAVGMAWKWRVTSYLMEFGKRKRRRWIEFDYTQLNIHHQENSLLAEQSTSKFAEKYNIY